MKRTIVIGDIHGCAEEFGQLLKEVEYNQTVDRLLLLGDLIDRGPDPAGTVALAWAVGAESVMGNHEEKALRWRKHELKRKADPTHYKNPMSNVAESRLKQWAEIPDEHWEWINKWPAFAHINEHWTAVHGGCIPDLAIEDQKPNELMRLRYVRIIPQPSGYNKYKMASLSDAGEAPEPKPGEQVAHWTELWTGPRDIVYGHYTRDDVHITKNTLGLDSGCVHGGALAAAIFEEVPKLDENLGFRVLIHKVQAKQVYVERRPWNDSME